jgi:Ca2+/Na+ antiporter
MYIHTYTYVCDIYVWIVHVCVCLCMCVRVRVCGFWYHNAVPQLRLGTTLFLPTVISSHTLMYLHIYMCVYVCVYVCVCVCVCVSLPCSNTQKHHTHTPHTHTTHKQRTQTTHTHTGHVLSMNWVLRKRTTPPMSSSGNPTLYFHYLNYVE